MMKNHLKKNKLLKLILNSYFLFILLIPLIAHAKEEVIILIPGYLTKVKCQGRLLVSAIGNEFLVSLEALPKELGCGVLLKPLKLQGKTNLILETSTGSIHRTIEILTSQKTPKQSLLEIELKGD